MLSCSAGIDEAAVMDPHAFGVQDELIAHSFASSFKDNAAQTCADIAHYLGPEGAGLLRPKSK